MKKLALALLAFLLFTQNGHAQYGAPSALDYPNPTIKDCSQLNIDLNKYGDHVLEYYIECNKKHFDAPIHMYVNCRGNREVAYRQCVSEKEELCRWQQTRAKELNSCHSSARATANTSEILDEIDKIQRQVKDATTILKDPPRYLDEKLMSGLDQATRKMMSFDQNEPALNSAAEEVVTMVDKFVKKGVKLGVVNPIARKFASENFSHIMAAHRRHLAELDATIARIQSFNLSFDLSALLESQRRRDNLRRMATGARAGLSNNGAVYRDRLRQIESDADEANRLLHQELLEVRRQTTEDLIQRQSIESQIPMHRSTDSDIPYDMSTGECFDDVADGVDHCIGQ